MTRWERIKCNFLGIHDREVITTIPCRMWKSNIFSGFNNNVSGTAKVKRCKCCGALSAWISDGCTEQKIDTDDAFVMIPSLKQAFESSVGN